MDVLGMSRLGLEDITARKESAEASKPRLGKGDDKGLDQLSLESLLPFCPTGVNSALGNSGAIAAILSSATSSVVPTLVVLVFLLCPVTVPLRPKGFGDDGDFQVTFDGVPGLEPPPLYGGNAELFNGELGLRQGSGEYTGDPSPFDPLPTTVCADCGDKGELGRPS